MSRKAVLWVPICLSVAALGLGGGLAHAEELYAGTSYPGWVYAYDGAQWEAISGDLGLAVIALIEFEGSLYAGTLGDYDEDGGYGEVWRYDGHGQSWTAIWRTPPVPGPNGAQAFEVLDFEVWDGDLYASAAPGGAKLYRYDPAADTFELAATMPTVPDWSDWVGIGKMYPWPQTGLLHVGDPAYDLLGHYDGTNLFYDVDEGGSCIWDIVAFNGRLYASVENGFLLSSPTGVGPNWLRELPYGDYAQMWDIEVFQGYMYTGGQDGFGRIDVAGNAEMVWEGESFAEQVTAMVVHGNHRLYFGTGRNVAFTGWDGGLARVYTYDGGALPTLILNADGTDPLIDEHSSIECLYLREDADGDGVADSEDLCPNTAIPEGVPTVGLGINRWALIDGDLDFDTTTPSGAGPGTIYSTTDTRGCSCEQIIAAQGLGKGLVKFGCSASVMDGWIALVSP